MLFLAPVQAIFQRASKVVSGVASQYSWLPRSSALQMTALIVLPQIPMETKTDTQGLTSDP